MILFERELKLSPRKFEHKCVTTIIKKFKTLSFEVKNIGEISNNASFWLM